MHGTGSGGAHRKRRRRRSDGGPTEGQPTPRGPSAVDQEIVLAIARWLVVQGGAFAFGEPDPRAPSPRIVPTNCQGVVLGVPDPDARTQSFFVMRETKPPQRIAEIQFTFSSPTTSKFSGIVWPEG